MATTTHQRLYHPAQKDYVTFLETSAESGGTRTLVEVELAPGGGNDLHFHRSYAEHFEVQRGTLCVQVGEDTYELEAGESAIAPPHAVHRFFNASQEDVVFRVELRPGSVGFEQSLQIVYGLASDGAITRSGMPKSLYHIAVALELSETYLPGILGALHPVFRALVRRARRKGIEQALIARYCS